MIRRSLDKIQVEFIMDCKELHSRDGYDLKYDRSSLARPVSRQESDQPSDPDMTEITNLENALSNLVSERNSLLNKESRNLKIIIDEARFLYDRLKALSPGSILHTSPDVHVEKSFRARRDACNEHTVLQNRKAEARFHRDALSSKLRKFLANKVRTFLGVRGGVEDILLYRIRVTPSSHVSALTTPRSSDNSFNSQQQVPGHRCSGWNSFGEITNEAILNHMNGDEIPTPMISAYEGPGNFLASLKNERLIGGEAGTIVEVISLQMLQHIGVLLARSVDLCRNRGIPTTFAEKEVYAQNATSMHWVIMHWIPEEAILKRMPVDEFLALARDRGIIDGKPYFKPRRKQTSHAKIM